MRLRLLLAFLLVSSTASVAQESLVYMGPAVATGRAASVKANLSQTGYTIPNDFVGLSGEVGDLIAGYYQGTSGHAGSFIGVMNLLGSHGWFRLGGNSSDTVTPPALTQPIATALASFVAGLGANWSIIYGLNLQSANSSLAATQAGYIATAFGAANSTFQFGNESIGNYYTKAQYQTNWNLYYTAVTGAVSGAKYAATDTEDFGDTPAVLAALTPGVAGISQATQHWYGIYNNQPVPNSTLTFSQVISSVAMNYYANAGNACCQNLGGYFINNQWAQLNNIKQRLSESNNINNLGKTGFSDALVSATWYLNQAITFANGGWAGINTHTTYNGAGQGTGKYNPIALAADGGFNAAPEFYGMYLFSKIEGQQTVTLNINGNANLVGIATKGSGNNANILIVNNDPGSAALITPAQSAAWTTANVLLVQDGSGLGCGDTTAIVGGAAIAEGGSWSGAPFSLANGASFSLPPCGAALIQVQP